MLERLHALLLRRMDKLMGQMEETAVPELEVDVDSLRQQGNRLLAESQLEAAEARFREGLHHAPDDVPLLICLGYSLKEQGRLSEARIPLRRAVMDSGNPEIVDALYLLGQISEQQGDLDDAKRQYTAALTFKPDFEPARSDMLRLSQPQP